MRLKFVRLWPGQDTKVQTTLSRLCECSRGTPAEQARMKVHQRQLLFKLRYLVSTIVQSWVGRFLASIMQASYDMSPYPSPPGQQGCLVSLPLTTEGFVGSQAALRHDDCVLDRRWRSHRKTRVGLVLPVSSAGLKLCTKEGEARETVVHSRGQWRAIVQDDSQPAWRRRQRER